MIPATIPCTHHIVAPDLVLNSGEQAAVAYSASVGIAVYVTSDIAEILASGDADTAEQVATLLDDEMVDQLIAAGILRAKGADPGAERRAALEEQIRNASTIRFLDLVVSEGCNYGCTHCIHSRDIETSPFRMLNTYMTVETAKIAIEEFVRVRLASPLGPFRRFNLAHPKLLILR